MNKTIEEMLGEMAGISDPFALFEPNLWYGKLGDEGWECSMNSVDAELWKGVGDTAYEAVKACYDKAMEFQHNQPQG